MDTPGAHTHRLRSSQSQRHQAAGIRVASVRQSTRKWAWKRDFATKSSSTFCIFFLRNPSVTCVLCRNFKSRPKYLSLPILLAVVLINSSDNGTHIHTLTHKKGVDIYFLLSVIEKLGFFFTLRIQKSHRLTYLIDEIAFFLFLFLKPRKWSGHHDQLPRDPSGWSDTPTTHPPCLTLIKSNELTWHTEVNGMNFRALE